MEKCIVLDLDGTLVFSSENKKGEATQIKFKDRHGDSAELYVHKRPGFDEFLLKCFSFGPVGVYSIGQEGYVEAILSLFPKRPCFVYSWWNCDRKNGKIIKNLNNIPYKGNIIMIDDKPESIEYSDKVELIVIDEWTPKKIGDIKLYQLTDQLFKNDF